MNEPVGEQNHDELPQAHDPHPVGHVAYDAQVMADQGEGQPRRILDVLERVDDPALKPDLERFTQPIAEDRSPFTLRLLGPAEDHPVENRCAFWYFF